jgi:hypothetical protein
MRNILALGAALLLSACASTYTHQVISAPTAKLERGKAVLVATPKNGSYNGKEYRSSGSQTAVATKAAFARFSNTVNISTCIDIPCLRAEGGKKYAYYVMPEILHWEDRNTEWSGKPDRVEIKLVVFDAQRESEVASTVISGKSKWATFGGDHPEDLLPEPITEYVSSLY